MSRGALATLAKPCEVHPLAGVGEISGRDIPSGVFGRPEAPGLSIARRPAGQAAITSPRVCGRDVVVANRIPDRIKTIAPMTLPFR